MNWRTLFCFIPSTALALACSTPELVAPDALEVVYLPLDGASGVTLSVLPKVYFSDDVDVSSVNGESVFMESANLEWNADKERWECSDSWESVDGKPEVDGYNARMVVFKPSDLLLPETCYRFTCTIAVRGVTRGPLQDDRIPGRPGVGAVQVFRTGTETGPVPPSVEISNPADGASFTAFTDINIAAEASDRDGTVEKVEFFEGANKLDEDVAAPYEITWSGMPAGSYTLTAKATDDDGLTGVSNPVQITVTSSTDRVVDGLVVLYTFEEAGDNEVRDVSGVGDPLNLTIDNTGAIDWIAGGLEVTSDTIVKSTSPATKVIDACMTSNEITVEAWINPAGDIHIAGPIVTVSVDQDNLNFKLEQYSTRLRATLHTTDEVGSRYRPVTPSFIEEQTGLIHAVFTRESDGQVTLYIDSEAKDDGSIGGNFSNWDGGYYFALANEVTEDSPWKGEFHLIAIYSRALTLNEVAQNFFAGP